MSKPFSEACENNKVPILAVISGYFSPGDIILEIGSLTTQHVQYFARQMPRVTWQPSDIKANLDTVRAGLAGVDLDNILPPLPLDVTDDSWPLVMADGVFSANTLHIMPESHIGRFFRGVGTVLAPQGHLCVYGPFNYNGEYTSESNARFDQWLKAQGRHGGIRDFEVVNAHATQEGLVLVSDHEMPANNRMLVWQKRLNYFPV